MPISFVGAGALAAGATTGPITPAFPAGAAVGDVLLCHAYSYTQGTIATPSGWTLLRSANVSGGGTAAVFRRVGQSGDTAPSISGPGGGIYAVCSAYRGVDPTTPEDVAVPAASTGSSTSVSAPSVTTATADAWVVWFHAQGDNNSLGSPTNSPTGTAYSGSGYATITGGDVCMGSAYKLIPTAGASGTCVMTASGGQVNTEWVGLTVALRPAASVQQVTVPGIASDEAFGTPVLTAGPVSVSPSGIPTEEAFGAPQVNLTVYPAGIASAEAFGSPTVVVGGLVSPTGIPSAEAFGTPTVTPGTVTLLPPGIPTAEAFGAASVANVISPTGIASAEAFGTAAVVVGAVTVTVTGIPSEEAFGTAVLTAGPVTVSPTGIASGEAFGSPSLSMRIYPSGIPSGEAFGTAVLTTGPVTVSPTGIPSEEAFGEPSFNVTIDLARLAGLIDTTQSGYELQCIARIPQQTGPPALLVVDRIKWKGLRYADVLSRPQELAATVQVASISDLVAQRLLGPDRQATELRLLRDGQIVAAGPLAGWHRRGQDVEIVAGGLLSYTQRMIVLADMRFDQVDQHLIAAALIDQWQNSSYGHGHYGIDTSRVSTSGRLRDRSYVRNEQHKVAQRIEELGAVDGGFDAEVDPTTRQLQLWHPFKGVDRSSGPSAVVLDRRVIASPDVMCSVAPGDLASLAFGTSSSAGSDGGLSSFQLNAELAASFGLSAAMGSWQDISEQATLDDHVRALLDSRSHALIVPGPQMRVTPDADLGAYDVGDTVQLELGTDQLGITGAYRIRKRSVSVAANGVETVDLELV